MQKKDSNVELFRIIAAYFVVVLHVLGQGGILANTSPKEANYWLAWFLEICAYCAVNCFALISGYVMVSKTVKTKNIINLWIQVLFYSLVCTVVIFALFPETKRIDRFVSAMTPVIKNQWWYISSYFGLFFFMPFLNTAIDCISRKTYEKLLLAILIGVCFICRIFAADPFILRNGYSASWLIIVYLFGAYIKKYELKQKITAFKSILGFFAMVLLTFGYKLMTYFVYNKVFGIKGNGDAFVSYTSITILLAAVFLLLFCLNIKIKNAAAKVICFLSPAALGVYLIHVHPMVFTYVIKDAFTFFVKKDPVTMFLCVIGTAILIYIVCTAIELVRIKLFKLLRINKLSEHFADGLNSLYWKRHDTEKVK